MAWTKYQMLIALIMVITGTLNTLTTKLADETESQGVGPRKPQKFNHPFLQACAMFLGEALCLIAFYVIRAIYKKNNKPLPPSVDGNSNFSVWIFLPPAMCDMTATSIMYVGLNMTYASSFQMLRGAVIIFTGLLSVAFLGRKLNFNKWAGILTVMAGLAIVGTSDVVFPSKTGEHYERNQMITGDLLIVMAQIITATQMVLEEKFVSKHNVPPLQAVGLEGIFGFVVLSILLVPMYFIPVGHMIFDNPNGQLEDAIDGFVQIANNWIVLIAILGTIVSIAFFNFAGVSVTKELSATTRMVLDSVRTLLVWLFSLAVGWQSFAYLQPIGFVVLVVGMALYNEVIKTGSCCQKDDLTQPLLENDLESGSSREEKKCPHPAPIIH